MKYIRRKDIIKKNKVDHINGERKIIELIEHPFIEKLKYVIKGAKRFMMLIDYDWHSYELFFYIQKEGKFSEEAAQFNAAQLVLIIEHLHKNNCIFRE